MTYIRKYTHTNIYYQTVYHSECIYTAGRLLNYYFHPVKISPNDSQEKFIECSELISTA